MGVEQLSALRFGGSPARSSVAGERTAPATGRPRKRLAFVIAHLGPGGAQRVAVTAANAFVERGHDVHLIVVDENALAYKLDQRVVLQCCREKQPETLSVSSQHRKAEQTNTGPVGIKIHSENKVSLRRRIGQVPWIATYVKPIVVTSSHRARILVRTSLGPIVPLISLLRNARRLRRRLRGADPDAVLSFLTQTNILTVLATRGLGTRTVISERNDPRLQRHRPRVEFMRWLVYRWADVVTANSRGALTALQSCVPKEKLAYLPNPLMPPASKEIAFLQAPTIITVGRLVQQKGIDVLLEAWAQASERLPGWRLAIVGDGPLRETLQARCRELGVENSVDWHGHLADPFPLLRASKFFVMTSRFEGTPNALLEAMSCGLPGIVTNASPGPCELVGSDESAGLIVPVEGAKETADAIIRLAREKPLRQRFAAAACERAREHELDQALGIWLQLLRCD